MSKRGDDKMSIEETVERLKAAKQAGPSAKYKLTRRTAVKLILSAPLAVAAGKALISGIDGWVFVLWDKLRETSKDPVETSKIKSIVEISDLFPTWSEFQIVPGTHHPIEGYAPDVRTALERLEPLVPKSDPVVFVAAADLRLAITNRDMVLIGGPITNLLSRQVHGYRFHKRKNKIDVRPFKKTGLRWCFEYPYPSSHDQTIIRYAGGVLKVTTLPKGIVDLNVKTAALAEPRFSRVDPENGLLESDYLLLTVVPNTMGNQSTGCTIIDVADLHGQGDKIFADLLDNPEYRKELANAVEGSRFFQALYEVPVRHDTNRQETTPLNPKLLDVHRLA